MWPESFEQPADFLADPSKMEMIVKVQREIDAAAVEHNINYHTKAEQGNLTLSNLVILRYLEGVLFKHFVRQQLTFRSCMQHLSGRTHYLNLGSPAPKEYWKLLTGEYRCRCLSGIGL